VLSPSSFSIALVDDVVLRGALYQDIKVEDSTWFVGKSRHSDQPGLVKKLTLHIYSDVWQPLRAARTSMLLELPSDDRLHADA
jgi:hypothetical protein